MSTIEPGQASDWRDTSPDCVARGERGDALVALASQDTHTEVERLRATVDRVRAEVGKVQRLVSQGLLTHKEALDVIGNLVRRTDQEAD